MVLPCEKMVGDPAFRPVLGRGAGGAGLRDRNRAIVRSALR